MKDYKYSQNKLRYTNNQHFGKGRQKYFRKDRASTMRKSTLHCHYYHTEGRCFKGINCRYIHGKRQTTCPNKNSCPIKTCLQFNQKVNQTSPSVMSSDTLPSGKQNTNAPSTPEVNELTTSPPQDTQKKIIFSTSMVEWDLPPHCPAMEIEESKKAAICDLKNTSKKTHFIERKQPKKPHSQLKIKRFPKVKETNRQNSEKEFENQELISKNNFLKIFSQMSSDIKQFLPHYKKEKQGNEISLDLMFIVDCTASMSSWIDAVKDEIQSVVSIIQDIYDDIIIYYSFIGYRDYDVSEDVRNSIFSFSPDLEAFQDFMKTVNAEGGNDEQEDVAGGFLQANKQKWTSESKYAIFIADAPAHGNKYCNSSYSGDRYPEGDPSGINLNEQVEDLLKKGVSLFVVEINQSTKTMFSVMNDIHKNQTGQQLKIQKLGNSVEHFNSMLSNTVNQTVSATLTRMSITADNRENTPSEVLELLKVSAVNSNSASISQLQNLGKDINQKLLLQYSGNKNNKNHNHDFYYQEEKKMASKSIPTNILKYNISNIKEFPEFHKTNSMPSICHTYFIVKKKGEPIDWKANLLQYSYINTLICIKDTPFAEGAMRYSFHALDTFLNQKMVVKLNKKQYVDNDQLNKERLIRDLESQFVCQHIVNEFNNRFSFHDNASSNLINFVHCFIYEIKNPSSNVQRYYAAENFIEGDYEKFNNNSGWCSLKSDDSGLLSQALSHFSYQITEGYLMIVDLQGVRGLYTDPQIHCLDLNRFGSGNLGYEGMFKFFLSHKCNRYCRLMNLVHPTSSNTSPIEKFFSSTIPEPTNNRKEINCICDLCKCQFSIRASYLHQRISSGMEKYCRPCDKKRVETVTRSACVKYDAYFNYSKYWYLMKRTERPERCVPCRKKRKQFN